VQKFIHNTSVGYLIFLVLIKMLALPLLCLQFNLNQEYIASTLCENKSKPQLQCSGKCVLMKKMNASGDMGKPDAQKTNFQSPVIDFLEHPEAINFQAETISFFPTSKHIQPPLAIGFTGNIFHPPIA
jgi:hypothetical protein